LVGGDGGGEAADLVELALGELKVEVPLVVHEEVEGALVDAAAVLAAHLGVGLLR
jgi:hypothetical protein